MSQTLGTKTNTGGKKEFNQRRRSEDQKDEEDTEDKKDN